jgi:hypothetical protein
MALKTPTKTIKVEVPDEAAIKDNLDPRMTAAEAFAYLGKEYDRAHGKFEENGGDIRTASRREACKELALVIRDGDQKETYTKAELADVLGEIQDGISAKTPAGVSAFEQMLAGSPVTLDTDGASTHEAHAVAAAHPGAPRVTHAMPEE